MTETTAKSGGSGTSTSPADGQPDRAGAIAAGRGQGPADAASPPKFTRAPGMPPPPSEPPANGDASSEQKRQGPPSVAKGSATVPIVTKGKGPAPGPAGGRVGAPGRPGETGNRQGAAGAAAVGAARVSEAVRAARSTVSSAAARGPRRARLNLKRIDPWSVMKFSFAVSVVLFIVVVVATSVLYLALDAMGVWTEVNKSLSDLVNASGGSGAQTSSPFRITAWGVIGTSMLIGAVNVVLFTALATLGAFVYNVCADLVGGVELTLAERD